MIYILYEKYFDKVYISNIIFYFSVSVFYSSNSHKILLNYFASNHISFLISILFTYNYL